jgi:hypothetical protein
MKKMKKLIYTIIIGATMVCCQSENSVHEIEVVEPITVEPKYNCLNALITEGKLTQVFDYWRNIIGMNGHISRLNNTQEHHFHCFDKSKYNTDQMIQMIKDKY